MYVLLLTNKINKYILHVIVIEELVLIVTACYRKTFYNSLITLLESTATQS